jgi:hypothetical protein
MLVADSSCLVIHLLDLSPKKGAVAQQFISPVIDLEHLEFSANQVRVNNMSWDHSAQRVAVSFIQTNKTDGDPNDKYAVSCLVFFYNYSFLLWWHIPKTIRSLHENYLYIYWFIYLFVCLFRYVFIYLFIILIITIFHLFVYLNLQN